MQITLAMIRELLRGALGFDSFVASFIRSIRESKDVSSACINAEGDVLYNPKFVEQEVKTKEDCFCLVFHELLHPFFRHYMYGGGFLANLGGDAVINAAISEVFGAQSGNGSLFRKLYKSEGLEMILRPGHGGEHAGRP